jgi:hypothetical protein
MFFPANQCSTALIPARFSPRLPEINQSGWGKSIAGMDMSKKAPRQTGALLEVD